VTVLPIDVNDSAWDCTLEHIPHVRWPSKAVELCVEQNDGLAKAPHLDGLGRPSYSVALRLGMRLINGLRQDVAERIVQDRTARPFTSLADFSRRTRLNRADQVRLAEADAFGSLRASRRQALWAAMAKDSKARPMPLLDGLEPDEDPADLPETTDQEEVFADYRTAGLSLRGHPMSFHREALKNLGITSADGLAATNNGKPVRVAGIVLLRQRPSTAKGITFVTLEDETGTINLIVHQRTWDRFAAVTRHACAWLAEGKLESKDGVIHVVVHRLEDLARRLATVPVKSRDFR
jgi:error-prone DNA polymerase